jgi:hypothetical protein
VTLNLSKRSASISVGERGAHLTVGTRGTTETVGLPGTGLYWTEHQGRGRPGQPVPHNGQWVAQFIVWLVLLQRG